MDAIKASLLPVALSLFAGEERGRLARTQEQVVMAGQRGGRPVRHEKHHATSCYTPHQGKREMERRRKRLALQSA